MTKIQVLNETSNAQAYKNNSFYKNLLLKYKEKLNRPKKKKNKRLKQEFVI